MKFMHIADVHLGVIPDKGKVWSDTRAREVQETFLRVLKEAKREQIDVLLIAGDLFHAPPTITMLKELDAQLLDMKNITTVIIAGNHDYMAPGSPMERYEFQSDTVVLRAGTAEQLIFDDLQTCITGISYHRKKIPEALYDDLTPIRAWKQSEESKEDRDTEADSQYPAQLEGYFQILLAHGGDAEHSPLNVEKLRRSGFDYLALGHIHKPEVLIPDRMIYAGSLEPIDHTDIGERGYVIGEATKTTDQWQVHTRWVPFSCRRYVNLEIELDDTWTNYQLQQTVEARIKETGSEHIYQIILEGQRSAGCSPELTGLKQLYYISDIIDHTHEALDYEKLRQEHTDDILGRLIEQLYRPDSTELELQALEYGVKALTMNRE